METNNGFHYVYDQIGQYILTAKPTFVLHGCNCRSTMGAGIARALKNVWKDVERVDMDYMRISKYDNPKIRPNVMKLGNFSSYRPNDTTTIVNLYTQIWPGPGEFNLAAFVMAYTKFVLYYNIKQYNADKRINTILMPRIGCGLARDTNISVNAAWTQVVDAMETIHSAYGVDNNLVTIIGLPNEDPNHPINSEV